MGDVMKQRVSLQGEVQQIVEQFRNNVEAVNRLAVFDHIVLDYVLDALGRLNEKLKKQGIENPMLTAQRAFDSVRTIRENDSFRPRYQEIFNQCVVLLVSYFASAIADLFRLGLPEVAAQGASDKLAREELRVTVGELQALGSQVTKELGDLFVRKKDISFQDMQSIVRAFREYMGIEIERDTHVHNIILGQAARHVIAHAGANVDSRFVRQVADATPRALKPDVVGHGRIQFVPPEIDILGESMRIVVDRIAEELSRVLGRSSVPKDGP